MKIEKIIREICLEEGLNIESFCDSYCLKLSKNNKSTYIYDSVFENNSSAVYKLLRDKSAVAEILSKQNLPVAEHYYFYSNSPSDIKIQQKLDLIFEKYKKLVIKHNEGMSGKDVYFIETKEDLKNLSTMIFQKFNALSVSPFYNILHEYRVVYLNGKVKLVFDKVRPEIIGDGKHTVKELSKQSNYNYIDKNINPNFVPSVNQKLTLSWRHNLNYGAIPKVVQNKDLINKLSLLAKKASDALKIKFASIDIIQTDKNDFKILEINGSVTMGKFAEFSSKNHEVAKVIYKEAIFSNLK